MCMSAFLYFDNLNLYMCMCSCVFISCYMNVNRISVAIIDLRGGKQLSPTNPNLQSQVPSGRHVPPLKHSQSAVQSGILKPEPVLILQEEHDYGIAVSCKLY